ncbi:integrase core domain-containing protein [Rhodococcus opacus]|uniref:integrase core domain-containing protein n=1 Tax=Rhodococcus opacus TaxID=37919 RepID=UPI0009BF03F3
MPCPPPTAAWHPPAPETSACCCIPLHTSVIEVLHRPVEPAQYTANAMESTCTRHGLRRSMGRTGVCWDNAGAESLWSTFKHEHYYRHTFATKAELVAAIDKWMASYNSYRRHSSIGMLSPDNYERSLTVSGSDQAA